MKYLDQPPKELFGARLTILVVIAGCFFVVFFASITY